VTAVEAPGADPVRLLWTGGWDSTFRLLHLLLVQQRAVQPVYLVSSGRASTMQELTTMERLRAEVLPRLTDPSLLRPTQVHLWSDFPPSPALREAYAAVAAQEHIGIQYLHLAAVAQALDWHDAEVGVIAADRWGARGAGPGSVLFERFAFPLLDLPKARMGEIAREHGFYDLLVQRWFCQTPLAGRPCGVCHPCRTATRDGVRFANPVPVYLRRAWRDPRVRRVRGAGARVARAPRAGRGDGSPAPGDRSPAPAGDSRRRQLVRRAVPARALTARRVARAWVGLLRAEWDSPVRFAAPSLLLRGYLSDRLWQYPTRPSRAGGYLSDVQYRRVVGKINPLRVQRAFNDKESFAAAMAAHGLADRLPRQLAVVTDGTPSELVAWDGPVVRKPVDGHGGVGVAAFDSLAEAIGSCPPAGTFLVQERVVGHRYATEIFPGSLNTLRVFAVRDAPGAPARVVVVVQRIGRAETVPLDSFSAGGLVAPVDLATGLLGPAVARVERRAREVFDHHPDTGGAIAGRQVPMLGDVVQLVERAMEVFPEALHVGWDVGVSERGPLIIEGNARMPSIRSVQAHGPFAVDPSCREFYQRWGLLPADLRPDLTVDLADPSSAVAAAQTA